MNNIGQNDVILLVLMPFWDPLIPPMGISCLKSYLTTNGYRVKIVDANIEKSFKEVHDKYFDKLSSFLPGDKKSNFNNIANEVYRNHMMAHLHARDEKQYMLLVQQLIHSNFYCAVEESQVYELNREIAEFYNRLEQYTLDLLAGEKPTIFGLSVFQGTVAASMFAFKLAREHYPGIKTIMGGGIFSDQLKPGSPNFDFFLQKNPGIDKFIVGEGEILFLKYLRGELPGDQKVYTMDDLGENIENILDISASPCPDFSDLKLDYYPHPAAYTSRGCPFMCKFCSETVLWKKYRKKNPAQVVAELNELYKQYKTQLFLMSDSLLNPVASGLAAAIINNPIPFYWDGYLRVDINSCNRDKVWEWRRGGFYRARLGMESGSQRILDLMQKKIKTDQIRETLVNLSDIGIKTTTYWVIGYPGETEEDFQQTLDLIAEMAGEIYEADCNPFNYYYSGQVNSDEWAAKRYLLYPEEAKDMLILQKWELDCFPSREEKYNRLRRFYNHCRGLGIPDPYSLYDINQADKRWQKLHKNAVPALAQFKEGNSIIAECRMIGKANTADFAQGEITFNL